VLQSLIVFNRIQILKGSLLLEKRFFFVVEIGMIIKKHISKTQYL
jgi:hypothetical protein